jgi:hypothetical protein
MAHQIGAGAMPRDGFCLIRWRAGSDEKCAANFLDAIGTEFRHGLPFLIGAASITPQLQFVATRLSPPGPARQASGVRLESAAASDQAVSAKAEGEMRHDRSTKSRCRNARLV